MFDELYKSDKDILFEILLKYKLYFKKQINLNKEFLNEIIKFSTKKDFKKFKEDGLFYLKDINTFIEITENNKDDIIKIKGFRPIEIPKVKDNEKIDFGIVNPKIEEIITFSKEKKLLLINFKTEFWDCIANQFSGKSRDNIELCSTLRILFNNYYKMVIDLFKEEKDNKIKKDMISCFKRGIFEHKLDKIIKEYIKTNAKITNIEIIELIKDYNKYYSDPNPNYINKREPEILSKIDLEDVNEEFIQKFKEMKFEKIFENDIENFFTVFTKKIKKINHFNIILDLININDLGSKKLSYLKKLKNSYKNIIMNSRLSENDENLIKTLTNIASFICVNEGSIEFLDKMISKSTIINGKIKHKIYLELIKFCKENNNEQIKKYIILNYSGTLKSGNLNEFIEFLVNLKEEDAKDFIEKLDDKYLIIEKEFYSQGKSLNIQLLNLIKQNLNLKEDTNFIKSNVKTLEKIANDIDNKEIKYEYLKNFIKDQKEVVMEKLNSLTLLSDRNVNQDEIYENLKKYYNEMKDFLDKLSNCKKSLELYHQLIKKEEISKLSANIEEIQKETYNNFYKGKSEIQDLLDESFDIVQKVNDIKDSKIFKIFYQKINKNNKNDKTTSIFDKAYEEFTKFKQLLVEGGADIINKDSNQNEIIKKIKEEYQEDKIIQNELSSLISGEQKNEEEIMIIFNSKNIENDLNAMFNFFSYLENENIKNEWNIWSERC